MRNENKFSTQKVREIFLMRAPPPSPLPLFLFKKQKQNSFCARDKTRSRTRRIRIIIIKLRSYYLLKSKIFFDRISSRFIPKILLVIPILQECFFREKGEEEGPRLFTHVQTTLFYS